MKSYETHYNSRLKRR